MALMTQDLQAAFSCRYNKVCKTDGLGALSPGQPIAGLNVFLWQDSEQLWGERPSAGPVSQRFLCKWTC